MQHLYSFRKTIVSLSLTFLGYAGVAQVCGPIAQNFDNTGGTTAGFTSTTLHSSAAGFTFGQTGQNGFLQRCNIPAAGTTYEIVSPTYQPIGAQTFVGYGFQLSGSIPASSVFVYFQYLDNTNNVNTVLDTVFINPTYTGTGGNATLTICDSFLVSRAAGFTPGENYRIVIDVVAASSSNNNQCIVFDNFRTAANVSNAPLPVAFVGFGAKKTAKGVELIWDVTGERDVQTYIVERSSTGNEFSRLGDVPANNSSSYSFIDNQPLSANVFYRIKEVDIDGKSRYSTIVKLNLDKLIALRAYPSPAKDQVTIEHSVVNKGTISITTTDGRVIKQIDVKPDLYQTVINVSNFKSGMYIVRFVGANGKTESIKLVKD